MSKKKCKGTLSAKGYGCGKPSTIRTYGLCHENRCYQTWLFNALEAKEKRSKFLNSNSKKVTKEKKEKDREKKIELNTGDQMRLADTYFSRYMRLKHSENQLCTCYTCGRELGIRQVDNGHYEKRGHQATRYHENNCRPQCKTCNGNTAHNGRQVDFRINLVNEIGEDEVLKIEALAKTSIKTSSKYFREIANKYRIMTNNIQKELGIKVF